MYNKVMIVDDTHMDRYIGERNIKKYNFAKEVVLKESALSALDYLASMEKTPDELPELIFLDIRMPEIDGFGFLEKYEKLPQSVQSACIIIMLSSSLDPEDHNKANTNRFVNRFLNKPLNNEQLKLLTESK